MKRRIVYLVVAVMLLTMVPCTTGLVNSKNIYLPANAVQTVELARHDRGPNRRPAPPPRHHMRPGPRHDGHVRQGHRPPPPPPPPRHGHRHDHNNDGWWWIIGAAIIANM